MTARQLTTEELLGRGFRHIGGWALSGDAIVLPPELPKERGVYVFLIDGIALYVGLASRSLSQRLAGYAAPGPSQVTNIRLNRLIAQRCRAGQTVSLLVASPPDAEWRGWRISGPQGLEAGLIQDFDLEWNVRGSTNRVVESNQSSKERLNSSNSQPGPQRGVKGRILDQIRKRPGMTELELAKSIFGPSAQQPQANTHCRALVSEKLVQRRGAGGRDDPFRYFPA